MALAAVDVNATQGGDLRTVCFAVVGGENSTSSFPVYRRRQQGGWSEGARNHHLCRLIPVIHQNVGVNERVTAPRTL